MTKEEEDFVQVTDLDKNNNDNNSGYSLTSQPQEDV